MFQFLFLEAVGRRTGCSRDSVLNLYNSSCGRPTAGMRAALKSEVGRILEVLILNCYCIAYNCRCNSCCHCPVVSKLLCVNLMYEMHCAGAPHTDEATDPCSGCVLAITYMCCMCLLYARHTNTHTCAGVNVASIL
jgi:hypothetical protein